MSARGKIIDKLVTELKKIKGGSTYNSNLYNNVFNGLKFWNEIDDYPSVFVTAGTETREYLPGGFKWAYLTVGIRVYVSDDYPELRLEEIFEDIENIVDNNGKLEYSTGNFTEDMRILSINTDEGLLNPIGVGEITLQILYDLCDPC
jgi:hypothetical protein